MIEVGRLAMAGPEDSKPLSQKVLLRLINLIYIYAQHIKNATDFVIEVHPRHVAFYARALGFQAIGGTKSCSRVGGALARLLCCNFQVVPGAMAVKQTGEQSVLVPPPTGLYRRFLSSDMKAVLIERMKRNVSRPAAAEKKLLESRISGSNAYRRFKKTKEASGTSRRRILFFGEAVSLSHVVRPLVLARWAREAGYDVRFACGPRYGSLVRAEGFEPLSIPTVSPDVFYGRLRRGQFFYRGEELREYMAAERSLIERWKPDLVVGDFRLTLSVSAQLSGVSMLALSNSHWSPRSPCPITPPRHGLLGLLPDSLRTRLFEHLRPLALRYFARPLDRVRRAQGLIELCDLRRHYTNGRYCAYLDLPTWFPVNELPEGHFFLGPVHWEPARAPDVSALVQRAPKPLAYLSMGSSGDKSLAALVTDVLLSMGWSVVLSGIDVKGDDRMRMLAAKHPKRCFPLALLGPRSALAEAKLTICHGGSGTVLQSLRSGVPVLCLPENPDQGLVSATVEAQGVGASLAAPDVSRAALKQNLARLDADAGLVSRTRKFASRLNAHDTQGEWLRALETMLHCGIGSERKQESEEAYSKGVRA